MMERHWLGILSGHEGILSRFTRDFDYKETNQCEIVYSYMLTEEVDKHGLCLLPLHYWDMFSGMCWEWGKFVFLPAVDCFLCPGICRSQSEGREQCECFPGFTDGIELSE